MLLLLLLAWGSLSPRRHLMVANGTTARRSQKENHQPQHPSTSPSPPPPPPQKLRSEPSSPVMAAPMVVAGTKRRHAAIEPQAPIEPLALPPPSATSRGKRRPRAGKPGQTIVPITLPFAGLSSADTSMDFDIEDDSARVKRRR